MFENFPASFVQAHNTDIRDIIHCPVTASYVLEQSLAYGQETETEKIPEHQLICLRFIFVISQMFYLVIMPFFKIVLIPCWHIVA